MSTINNKPSRYEKETIITYNEEDKLATVYTHNTKLINKLIKDCEKFPDKIKLISQDEFSKTFELPKKLIGVRSPRIFTEEQRKKQKEQALKLFHQK